MGRWLTGNWFGRLLFKRSGDEVGAAAPVTVAAAGPLAVVEIVRRPAAVAAVAPPMVGVAKDASEAVSVRPSASRPLAAMLASQARINVPVTRSKRVKPVAAPAKKATAPRSVFLQARRSADKHVVRRSADVVSLPLKRQTTPLAPVRPGRVAA